MVAELSLTEAAAARVKPLLSAPFRLSVMLLEGDVGALVVLSPLSSKSNVPAMGLLAVILILVSFPPTNAASVVKGTKVK